MSTPTELPAAFGHAAFPALWGYLSEVTAELGIGLESCVLDHDIPVSAYIALDVRLPHYPGRDVALLWDERYGWSVAIETHSGEDLIVLRYLGGDSVIPAPQSVARFVAAVEADDHALGRPNAMIIREATDLAELESMLTGVRRSFGRAVVVR